MSRPWNEGGDEKPYSVTLWFGNPDTEEGEDCCNTGKDFATLEEARACMADLNAHFSTSAQAGCAWVMLDGPDVHEVTCDSKVLKAAQLEERLSDSVERSERAMQAGMMGGCQAYNEAMGYD